MQDVLTITHIRARADKCLHTRAEDAGTAGTRGPPERVVLIRLAGPLGLSAAPRLLQVVNALVREQPGAIMLDVAAVVIADEMGPLALSELTDTACRHGVRLVLAASVLDLRERLHQLGVSNLQFVPVAEAAQIAVASGGPGFVPRPAVAGGCGVGSCGCCGTAAG